MNCKENDLAYIKKALRPANIGRVVTCKSLLGYFSKDESFMWNGEKFYAYDTDHHWVIECSSGLETMFGESKEAVIIDSWLIPIRADGLDIEQENKELLEDEALV